MPHSASAVRPVAAVNPALLAASASGNATKVSPTEASATLEPLSSTGAIGRAWTVRTGATDPNTSSALNSKARARASATRSEGPDLPDSARETSWRDTPAVSANRCCENPLACRADRKPVPSFLFAPASSCTMPPPSVQPPADLLRNYALSPSQRDLVASVAGSHQHVGRLDHSGDAAAFGQAELADRFYGDRSHQAHPI